MIQASPPVAVRTVRGARSRNLAGTRGSQNFESISTWESPEMQRIARAMTNLRRLEWVWADSNPPLPPA